MLLTVVLRVQVQRPVSSREELASSGILLCGLFVVHPNLVHASVSAEPWPTWQQVFPEASQVNLGAIRFRLCQGEADILHGRRAAAFVLPIISRTTAQRVHVLLRVLRKEAAQEHLVVCRFLPSCCCRCGQPTAIRCLIPWALIEAVEHQLVGVGDIQSAISVVILLIICIGRLFLEQAWLEHHHVSVCMWLAARRRWCGMHWRRGRQPKSMHGLLHHHVH
mmetsp:Transcript_69934/g.130712  ORF Transcript_69934/g.130712 Transcript_69934/m.130712 type:complete len:221 (-) Transcript_69934:1279-1941(-)